MAHSDIHVEWFIVVVGHVVVVAFIGGERSWGRLALDTGFDDLVGLLQRA